MMAQRANRLPVVYSCSGCSSAAQMANFIALRLDREGVAEMSCIAGVGGAVPHLVKTAISGRPILALDGCPLSCARACLNQCGVEPTAHIVLSEHGVKKRYHAEFDQAEAEAMLARVRPTVTRLYRGTGAGRASAAKPEAI